MIQKEPIDSLDPETRGLVASIGIVKGKPFKPDARMKKLLTEAVAIGNATARAILFQPREKAAYFYPDSTAPGSWPISAMTCSSRSMVPAISMLVRTSSMPTRASALRWRRRFPGKGSDYAMAFLDSKKRALNGAKTYKLHLPPERAGQQLLGRDAVRHPDPLAAADQQSSPDPGQPDQGGEEERRRLLRHLLRPEAAQRARRATGSKPFPGKAWFTILRMYGPLKPWIDKTWRPSEIELVK